MITEDAVRDLRSALERLRAEHGPEALARLAWEFMAVTAKADGFGGAEWRRNVWEAGGPEAWADGWAGSLVEAARRVEADPGPLPDATDVRYGRDPRSP